MANVCIVTGGASGLGLATSKLLQSHGWQVIIFDRASKGAQVAQSINADFIEADITDYTRLSQAFKTVWIRYGRLDFGALLTFYLGPAFTPAAVDNESNLPAPLPMDSLNVNLHGAINTAYLALQYLRRTSGPKSIILTASTGGLYPVPAAPLYAAAKHGIIGFTRSIADRLMAGDGIRVNCVCPGAVKTGIMAPGGWDDFPDHVMTTPEQIATAVKATMDNQCLFGQVVEVVQDSTFLREAAPFLDERVERFTALTAFIVKED
ncbi:hypothetical protein BJX99DRAFT_259402 [Aspergillus californicus]